jgi:cysteine desulfurase/selenocysteine lyase
MAHEESLLAYAMQRLGELNWLTIYGKPKNKGSIVSFNIEGAHPHDVSTILDRYGVAVRAGTHCCEPLLARYGVTSTSRASFAMYNTFEEVDRLVEALHKAREMFA